MVHLRAIAKLSLISCNCTVALLKVHFVLSPVFLILLGKSGLGEVAVTMCEEGVGLL